MGKNENIIIGIALGLMLAVSLSIFVFLLKPETNELIDCKTEKIFIDYRCEDGRFGFATLEEWSEIHDGCYNYKYYHKCKGINKLISSSEISQMNRNGK